MTTQHDEWRAKQMTDKIDLSKIQPGDEVTVRGVVKSIRPDLVLIKLSRDVAAVAPEDVVTFTPVPRPLVVGDRVHFGNPNRCLTILALYGDKAWLRDASDCCGTHDVSALRRAE